MRAWIVRACARARARAASAGLGRAAHAFHAHLAGLNARVHGFMRMHHIAEPSSARVSELSMCDFVSESDVCDFVSESLSCVIRTRQQVPRLCGMIHMHVFHAPALHSHSIPALRSAERRGHVF